MKENRLGTLNHLLTDRHMKRHDTRSFFQNVRETFKCILKHYVGQSR
jgi:hypothetical protein